MDNLEELLRALADDNSEDTGGQEEGSDGVFQGLNPETLLKMLSLLETLGQPDDNERFLLALKPLLREENRGKIDSAIRLLKLFTLLPILKESGLLETLI